MYKYASRNIEMSIGLGNLQEQNYLTTKDTKEHKGEYEAWQQPEMLCAHALLQQDLFCQFYRDECEQAGDEYPFFRD
jgi:hypothetical protein